MKPSAQSSPASVALSIQTHTVHIRAVSDLAKGHAQKVLESVGELPNFRCVVELLERQVIHGSEALVTARPSRDPQASEVDRIVTNSLRRQPSV